MKVLNASYDGDENQRRKAAESLGQHVCGAGDDLTTRRFCKAWREQDPVLMNEVIAELLPQVTDHLAKRLQQRELSHGVAQIAACKALLKALRYADRFDCRRSIVAWVCGIGHNEVINIFRERDAGCGAS